MKPERDFLVGFVLLTTAVVVCVTLWMEHLEGVAVYEGSISTGILPNPKITPGATNQNITQKNIGQTICNKNWSTSSIRPSSSYTTTLKQKQIIEYGYSDKNVADYEEDHLISLELGGDPTDPNNLWPEPYAPVPGAKQKDMVENYLHAQVCVGSVSLGMAQEEIEQNWYAVFQGISGSHALGGTQISDEDPDDI